jgi:hypothetical protein
MQIRKQDNNLTITDLMQYPVWEYTLDEEVVQDQNEKTLRPLSNVAPPSRDNVYFLVRAIFTLVNRTTQVGFIKPIKKGDDKLMLPLLPYDLNPVIVTERGHVHFCYGVFKPDEATISRNYELLGYDSENIFPIKFRSDIEVGNSYAEGVLNGFLYFDQDKNNFFKLISTDIKLVR